MMRGVSLVHEHRGRHTVSRIAPVFRSKAAARANYDRRSGSYERVEGRFERKARIAGEALLSVEPREWVLEIGSGPGASLATFARATGTDGFVVGIDIAPRMHRVAAERLRGDHLAAPVGLVVADGAHVPLRDRSVDAAFTSFTLELFDTPELLTVLGELRRPPARWACGHRLAHHDRAAGTDGARVPRRTPSHAATRGLSAHSGHRTRRRSWLRHHRPTAERHSRYSGHRSRGARAG